MWSPCDESVSRGHGAPWPYRLAQGQPRGWGSAPLASGAPMTTNSNRRDTGTLKDVKHIVVLIDDAPGDPGGRMGYCSVSAQPEAFTATPALVPGHLSNASGMPSPSLSTSAGSWT